MIDIFGRKPAISPERMKMALGKGPESSEEIERQLDDLRNWHAEIRRHQDAGSGAGTSDQGKLEEIERKIAELEKKLK